jgi:hypothetical protein
MEPETVETPVQKNESIEADLGNIVHPVDQTEKDEQNLQRLINTDGRSDTPGT